MKKYLLLSILIFTFSTSVGFAGQCTVIANYVNGTTTKIDRLKEGTAKDEIECKERAAKIQKSIGMQVGQETTFTYEYIDKKVATPNTEPNKLEQTKRFKAIDPFISEIVASMKKYKLTHDEYSYDFGRVIDPSNLSAILDPFIMQAPPSCLKKYHSDLKGNFNMSNLSTLKELENEKVIHVSQEQHSLTEEFVRFIDVEYALRSDKPCPDHREDFLIQTFTLRHATIYQFESTKDGTKLQWTKKL